MKDHLISEQNLIEKCSYCNTTIKKNEWNSSFDIHHHYKETICEECNRTTRITVNFYGSGHDNWDTNSKFYKLVGGISFKKSLEEKIKQKS